MRLKKSQKEAVLRWAAEGLKSNEINERAAVFEPPFFVSRRQAEYYRKRINANLSAIIAVGELDALAEGLAVVDVRVTKLKQLAALLEQDLFGGFLWVEQIKSIGSGDDAQVVEYEEFNKAEVDAYRGVLDDIAKEMGHRREKGSTVEINLFDVDEWKARRSERLRKAQERDDPTD